MGDPSKESAAAKLFGDLLYRLSQRARIRDLLGELEDIPPDSLLEELLDQFEKILEDRRFQHIISRELSATPLPGEPGPAPTASPPSTVKPRLATEEPATGSLRPPDTTLHVDVWTSGTPAPAEPPGPKEVSNEPVVTVHGRREPPPEPPERKEVPKEPAATPRARKESPPEPKKASPSRTQQAPSSPRTEPAPAPSRERPAERGATTRKGKAGQGAPPREQEKEEEVDFSDLAPVLDGVDESTRSAIEELFKSETPAVVPHAPRPSFAFSDDDLAYLHAVTEIPAGETPSREPFMMEEKGIAEKQFVFALDYEGLRFYLSRLVGETASVSRSGILLLNKQDSIRLWGVHEGILNDLRVHGTLLPFDFGTTVRGKDQLLTKVDDHLGDLRAGVSDVLATTSWRVGVYVLDDRIVEIVGSEQAPDSPRRDRHMERDRASYTMSSQAKKFDIKVLERLLQREKRMAEAVHEELKAVVDRSDLELMVSLGSGSSQDWKPILRASYEIAPAQVHKFYRTVVDLQYQHLLFDLVLAVRGKTEEFTFGKR